MNRTVMTALAGGTFALAISARAQDVAKSEGTKISKINRARNDH